MTDFDLTLLSQLQIPDIEIQERTTQKYFMTKHIVLGTAKYGIHIFSYRITQLWSLITNKYHRLYSKQISSN